MSLDTLSTAARDSTLLVVRTIIERAPEETILGYDKSTLVAGAIGILGVLIGAYVTWAVERGAKRRDLSYAMHREFFGMEMGRIRFDARLRLPDILDKSLLELQEDRVNAEKNLPIWHMLRFYQRLSVMMKSKEVDPMVVTDLFRGSYDWWYAIYLKYVMVDATWIFVDHLTDLKHSMDRALARKIRRESWLDILRKKKNRRAAKLRHLRDVVWPEEGRAGRAKVVAEALALGKKAYGEEPATAPGA